MNSSAVDAKLGVSLSRTRGCPGFYPGMKQPSLVVELRFPSGGVSGDQVARIEQVCNTLIPGLANRGSAAGSELDTVASLISGIYEEVLRKAGLPVLGESLMVRASDPAEFRFYLPMLDHLATEIHARALHWVVGLVNLLLARESPNTAAKELGTVIAGLSSIAPRGINSRHFIENAADLGVPWKRLAGNNYRFGWGCKSHIFDSSFTDNTPVVGVNIARDKRLTAQLLHAAGFPAPRHATARDASHAVSLAEQLGYPVVVKPADTDGGVGIATNLKNAVQVEKAYWAASSLSRHILVEKYFEGEDYRVHVLHDEVYFIAHRIPGGVTGDGVRTVVALLEEINADPRRGPRGSNALLKRIDLDEEALELLAEAGLSPDAIPAQGQFVRLRRAANVASGGIPVPALEGAHPDNLELAVRATQMLRLDVAGIDLLIPDIRQSWLESGALICEINSQPQLSPHLPAFLLQRLIPGNGRIPVVVVLGGVPVWLDESLSRLAATGLCLGVLHDAGASIGGHTILGVASTPFQRCEALLCDRRVEAAVLCVNQSQWMQTGFPVDGFDHLVLGNAEAIDDSQVVDDVLPMLLSLCRGDVLVDESSRDAWIPGLVEVSSARICKPEKGWMELVLTGTIQKES